MGVFIIDIFMGFSGFIKFVILPQRFVIGYGRIKCLSRGKRCFELCSSLSSLCFLKEEGTTVEIVSSLASLPSLSGTKVSIMGGRMSNKAVILSC